MIFNIPAPLGEKPKKEMLSISYEIDPVLHCKRPVVKINNSSLDLIQTCKRKAYYALKKELSSTEESLATVFGTAIHKGLESWYTSPKQLRKSKGSSCQDDIGESSHHADCARCASIFAFSRAASSLYVLDIGDKRHPYNGYRILHAYFDKYLDDPFEVYRDDTGPFVERRFEFTLIDKPDLKVISFGTIDAVLKNVETNTILVCDHKTTSTLGADFYNRIKPNFQYTLYVMGVNKAFGIQTDLFLVNGLQVAKTKADLARQVTQRTESDFEEVTIATEWAVRDYLKCLETNVWPQTSPNPCTMYGGCQYRVLCEAPAIIRPQIEENMFRSKT